MAVGAIVPENAEVTRSPGSSVFRENVDVADVAAVVLGSDAVVDNVEDWDTLVDPTLVEEAIVAKGTSELVNAFQGGNMPKLTHWKSPDVDIVQRLKR